MRVRFVVVTIDEVNRLLNYVASDCGIGHQVSLLKPLAFLGLSALGS